jgi:molybdopterin synthase sulfur carrier subunit
MVTVLVFGRIIQDAVGENEFSIKSAEPTTVRKLIEANVETLGALLRFIDSREALISVNKKVCSVPVHWLQPLTERIGE